MELCPNTNYVKMTLKVVEKEFFDSSSKLIVLKKSVKKNAILHSEQFNNRIRFKRIQEQMWSDVCEENRWDLNLPVTIKTLCKFTTVRVPKKCAPITYRI